MGLIPKDLNKRFNPSIIEIDVPKDQYISILDDMVLAFLRKRVGCENKINCEQYCRDILDTCISGYKRNGKPWHSAPGKHYDDWYDVLKKRLKVYKYDIEKREVIPGNTKTSEKLKKAKEESIKNILSIAGGDVETWSGGKVEPPTYGGDVLTISEKRMKEEFIERLKNEFPEQITAAEDIIFERLGLLYVINMRDISSVSITDKVTDQIKNLIETLGISGKQRVNLSIQDKTGTISKLIEIYEETKKSFIDAEKEYILEELTLISNAIHRGTIDEFLGMSHIRIIAGDEINGKRINIDVVDNYLKSNGIKVLEDDQKK